MDGRFSREEAEALETMGLGLDTDRPPAATLNWCAGITPTAMAGTGGR